MKRFLICALLCSLVPVAYAQRKTVTEDYNKTVYEDIPFSQMSGKLTYGYIIDEDGDKLFDGPYSIRCNQPTQTYSVGSGYLRLSGSFTLNTTYSKGKLNGTLTAKYNLNCTASYGFRTDHQTFTASATAGFLNAIPNGVFKVYHDTGATKKSTLSANYKNGVLVGAFSCSFLYDGVPTEYKGTLTQTGKPTGIWNIDGAQYEFLNGVLISRSNDNKPNPRVIPFAKQYANGTITEEELRAQNIILEETNMSLNSYVLYALRNHGGMDFQRVKGWNFSECQAVKYVELHEVPMLTDDGIKCLVKDQLALELGQYHEAKYIVCDRYGCDKYAFLGYNEDRQAYYVRIYSDSNTPRYVTSPISTQPGAVYLKDEQYQYLDSVFTASRLKRLISLRDAIVYKYSGSRDNSIQSLFSNSADKQFNEYDLTKIREEIVDRIDSFKRFHNNYGSYLLWAVNYSQTILFIDPNTIGDGDALLQEVDNAIYKLRAESAWTLSDLLSQGFSVLIKDKQQQQTYLSLLETHEAPNLPLEELITLRKTFATILEEYNTQSVENDYYGEWEYDFDGKATAKTYLIKAGSEAELEQIIENLSSAINTIMFNNVVETFDFMVKKGKAESIVKDKKFGNYFTFNAENPEWKTQAVAALQPFCKLLGYDILNFTETSVTCRLFVKEKKQQLIYEVELQHTNGHINIESLDISKAKLVE